VGAAHGPKADDGCCNETEKTDANGCQERLSHDAQSITPSAFVVQWVQAAASSVPDPKRALDLAMGRGRHAVVLARAGFKTFGVDVKRDALREAASRASRQGVRVHAWCADLTQFPLPRARFELVLATRYLQRDLFGAIRGAVVPGGIVIYETFTIDQRALGTGPTSPDYLLAAGELRDQFTGFEVLFYEEIVQQEAVARLVVRKPEE